MLCKILYKPDFFQPPFANSLDLMEKKQINNPWMTLNFRIWVGGVFMLCLFGLLAHFVWGIL
jgi:hypothetical protein